VLGFGLFGGSNGYWRADSLRAVKLDPSALTEDIDASVRLLRSGGRIVADPGIVSAEMAPPTIGALCHQRMRWGQGWYQVTRRHLASVMTDRHMSLRQRLGVAWVFGFGTVMAWIGALVLPLSLAGWFSHEHTATSPITSALFAFGTLAFIAQIAVAYGHALPESRRPSVFASYVVANLVFYAYLRVALVRLSHLHEMVGMNQWRVTPRARPKSRSGSSRETSASLQPSCSTATDT
jgi:cellulose synthase/poly-beta-1,6-N-acetylglucosamine synthase-like glycosyltransferase